MTILVGQDGTGWTTTTSMYGGSGAEAYWLNAGYAPVANGTATTAYVNIAGWGTATQAKVLVFNAATGVLLAQSGNIAQAGGTGLRSASITLAVSTSTQLKLAVLPDAGYLTLVNNTGAPTWTCYIDAMTYATPDDPLPAGSNVANPEFIIWLDGTVSGASGHIKYGMLSGVGL